MRDDDRHVTVCDRGIIDWLLQGEDTVVRVHRLMLPEDDAILDMSDTVEDILEEGATHVFTHFLRDYRRLR